MKPQLAANKWLVLFTLALMPFMATVDGSATLIALPVMADSMGVSTEAAQMVQICYLIGLAVTTLLFGRLGDIKGKGRIFLFGIALFTVGSFLSVVSQSFPLLLCARTIEAIGASAAMATDQGIVTETFPPEWRGRALGIVGMAVAVGAMAGPPLGGLLVSINWHLIYMINIPVGILVLVIGLRILPRGEVRKLPLDIKGAILLAVPILLVFITLFGGQISGYNKAYVPILLIAAAVLFLLFIVVEKKADSPLLDLDLFKNPLLTLSILCLAFQFFAMASTSVIQPYYLEDVRSLSAGQASVIMVCMSIALAAASPLSGWIADKAGVKLITVIGTVMMAAALFLFATQSLTTSIPLLVLFMSLLGVGAGLFNSPNNSIIMSTATKSNLGVTGSLVAFTRSFSNTLGTSLITVMFYSLMGNELGYKVTDFVTDQPQVFVDSMQSVYLICAVIMFGSVALSAARFFTKKRAAASPPAPKV